MEGELLIAAAHAGSAAGGYIQMPAGNQGNRRLEGSPVLFTLMGNLRQDFGRRG